MNLQPAGEDAIPQVALKSVEVKMAQLRIDVAKRSAKVGGIMSEMFDYTQELTPPSLTLRALSGPLLTLRALIQAFLPIAPVSTQHGFLFFLRSAVEFIGCGEG